MKTIIVITAAIIYTVVTSCCPQSKKQAPEEKAINKQSPGHNSLNCYTFDFSDTIPNNNECLNNEFGPV